MARFKYKVIGIEIIMSTTTTTTDKIPLIPNWSYLSKIPTVDQNEDVYVLRPIYQKGKIVAYLKDVMLAPKNSGKANSWGLWAPMWEDEYKTVEEF